jgi:CARDB
MCRLALLTIVLAALLAPAAQAGPPVLGARVTACTTGQRAAERTAAFTGSMPAVAGSRRMGMRFDLRQRIPPSAVYAGVRVRGLGVWHRSRRGRSGFVFTQRVQDLAAPGAYLAVVRFRWYDARGRVVRSARRQTRACRQPDSRPDLRVGEVDATAGPVPGSARYRVVVRNDGRGAAGPFDVVVTPDGAPQPAQRLGGLAAGERQSVTVIGPRCTPGSTLRVVVDARAEVAERDEADDVDDRVCPFASGPIR